MWSEERKCGNECMKWMMGNDTVELVLEEKSRKVFGRTDRGSFYTGVKLSKDMKLNEFVLEFLLEAHTRIKQSEDVLEGIFLEEQGYLSET